MDMAPEDRDRITAAIRDVEGRTSGEIVCGVFVATLGILPLRQSPRTATGHAATAKSQSALTFQCVSPGLDQKHRVADR